MILVASLSFLVVAWGVFRGNVMAMFIGVLVMAMAILCVVTARGELAPLPVDWKWTNRNIPGEVELGLRADGVVVWRKVKESR